MTISKTLRTMNTKNECFWFVMPHDLVHWYGTINSTKSPASATGNANEPGLTSHVGRMRDVAFT